MTSQTPAWETFLQVWWAGQVSVQPLNSYPILACLGSSPSSSPDSRLKYLGPCHLHGRPVSYFLVQPDPAVALWAFGE